MIAALPAWCTTDRGAGTTLVERLRDWLADLGIELSDRNQVMAVLALAAVLVLAGVWVYGKSRPAPVIVREAGAGGVSAAQGGGPGAKTAATAEAESTIAVHVAGAVRRPGMVRVPKGARVNDAVVLAGGPVAGADLDAVNLAAKLSDAQQIVVPRKGANPAGGVGGTGSAGQAAASGSAVAGAGQQSGGASAGGKVDINRATVTDFDALQGVGPVIAQRLFQYRTEHGRFGRVEDLQQVDGIGPKKFAQLREQVICTP